MELLHALLSETKLSEMTGYLPSFVQTDKKMNPYFEYLQKNGKLIGHQDGYDVVYAKGNSNSEHYYGLKDEKGDIITILLLVNHTPIDNKSTKEFKFIHTKESRRGESMSKRLLFFVKHHEGSSLIDYGMQSDMGVNFLKSLAKTQRYNIFWYNVKTKEKQPYNYTTDEKGKPPFRSTVTQTNWRILIEKDESPIMERFYLPPTFPGAPESLRYRHYHSLF